MVTRAKGSSQAVVACAVVLAALAAGMDAARAGYIPVCGGPTYDPATGTGYTRADYAGGVTNAGLAVGCVEWHEGGIDKGDRAVRWDASGTAVELDCPWVGRDGYPDAEPAGLNEAGTAVGTFSKYEAGVDKGSQAVRWDASGTAATELGRLGTDVNGYAEISVSDINAAGTAAGWATKYEGGVDRGPRAVRWDAAGTAATEVGTLGTYAGGYGWACGHAINGAGTVVGVGYKLDGGGERAVRWDASGTAATELGHLGTGAGGYTGAAAIAVNDAGTALGYAIKFQAGGDKGTRAVRWEASGTEATELGHLGTDASGCTYVEPRDINGGGTAVGSARKYEAGVFLGSRAVRWDASGTAATELGHLGTGAGGWAETGVSAINDAGIAVGWALEYDAAGTDLGLRAVYWGLDAEAVDLNTLIDPASGWTLTCADVISDTGWVAGVGEFDPDGPGGWDAYDRLFLMQIPEPATLALLAAGLLVLRRRRR